MKLATSILLACIGVMNSSYGAESPVDFRRGEVSRAIEHINKLDPKLPGAARLKNAVKNVTTDAELLRIYLVATSDGIPIEVRSSAAVYIFCLGDRSGFLTSVIFTDILRSRTADWNAHVAFPTSKKAPAKLRAEHLLWSIKGAAVRLTLEELNVAIASDDREISSRLISLAALVLDPQQEQGNEVVKLMLLLLGRDRPNDTILAAAIATKYLDNNKSLDLPIEPNKVFADALRYAGSHAIIDSETTRSLLSKALFPVVLDESVDTSHRIRSFEYLKLLDPKESLRVLTRLRASNDKINTLILVGSKE